jgi:subtilisin family serine protease
MQIGKPSGNSPAGQGLNAQQLQAQQAAYVTRVTAACQFGKDQTKRSFLVSLTDTCAGVPTVADAANPGLVAAQKMHVSIVQKGRNVPKQFRIDGWLGYTVEFVNATACVDYFLNDAKGFEACIADELVAGQVYIPTNVKGKSKGKGLIPPAANESSPGGQWLTDYTTQSSIPGAPTIVMSPGQYAKKTPWQLDLIDQRQPTAVNGQFSYPSIAGKDVDIYVVDSGIDPNQIDIKGRVVFGVNTADDVNRDLNGHGTEIATNVGGTYAGVAKKAKLIDVKVLSGIDKPGDIVDLVAGLEWIATQVQKNGRAARSVVKYVYF